MAQQDDLSRLRRELELERIKNKKLEKYIDILEDENMSLNEDIRILEEEGDIAVQDLTETIQVLTYEKNSLIRFLDSLPLRESPDLN